VSSSRLNFEKLLSLVQGASWALALAGSGYLFLLFLPFGFMIALIVSLFSFLVAFFFVVVCEIAQIQLDKLHELRKHTELLERLTQTKSLEL
jgi:fatty acid desaturase